MLSPQEAPESDDRNKQLWIYIPHQPWPMPSRRLQRVRPDSASLLTLPQELRDVIFDLVYYDEQLGYSVGHYIEHDVWERGEKARRRAGGAFYVSPPFNYGVNNLMVSKAFFVDAAAAFVKYRMPVTRAGDLFGDDCGILAAYTTTTTLHGDVLSTRISWPKLPQLMSLKLQVDASTLGEYQYTDCVWWRLLTLQEIRELAVYQRLMLFEHLRWIEVIDDEWRWSGHDTWTPSEIEMWEWNLELFEVTVNQDLLERMNVRRPTSGLVQAESVPLYPGSKVSSPFLPSQSVTPRTSALASTPIITTEPDAQDLPVTTSSPLSLPSPPPRRNRLLDLPQELRDTIFSLAFPYEDVKNISRGEWESREKKARREAGGSSNAMARFNHKVNEFMVSKAFFEEAARAFVGHSTGFVTGPVSNYIGDAWSDKAGIFVEYTTKISIASTHLDRCRALTNLTSLEVYIDIYDFEEWDADDVWRYPVSAEEVRKLRCYERIMSCQSLKEVAVVSAEIRSESRRSDAECAVWRQRLQTLVNTVREGLRDRISIVQRTQPTESHEPPSAYAKSSVHSQSSTPQPTPPWSDEVKTLRNSELPESVSDLDLLILQKPHALLNWIRHARDDRHHARTIRAAMQRQSDNTVRKYGIKIAA
ncbi:hypothetical protein LTR74_003558 [Friedmanniomyces endolithicus]|nr:hypothetical protein LTR74_003558 [Friedmanniomyces endolithicus]